MPRKSGKDYRKQYQDLVDKQSSLNAKVTSRLYDLCIKYPDVMLPKLGRVKSGDIVNRTFIGHLDLITTISCIETIEEHIANLHPHKQTKMF